MDKANDDEYMKTLAQQRERNEEINERRAQSMMYENAHESAKKEYIDDFVLPRVPTEHDFRSI